MVIHNAVGDIPSIASTSYAGTAYQGAAGMGFVGGLNTVQPFKLFEVENDIKAWEKAVLQAEKAQPVQEKKVMAALTGRRLVKIVIIDPDENVPLNQCVLYSSEEKLTDLNDQELFFEIDIKQLLDAHNAKRTKLIDKKVKERSEKLEAAKIRDLKMVVVNIATF